MAKPQAICIIYGVNEGPAISKKFRAACKTAGFIITTDQDEADIIVAHSGGALLVPEKPHAQRIFLIGIAYWPGKRWLVATTEHLKGEAKLNRSELTRRKLIKKWAWRAIYFWKLRTMMRMYHNQNLEAPWNNAGRQIIIRNRYDAYCCPDIHEKVFRGPRTFISLLGTHDDCWDNPTPYVNLLQSDV